MFDDTESIYTARGGAHHRETDAAEMEQEGPEALNLENELIAADGLGEHFNLTSAMVRAMWIIWAQYDHSLSYQSENLIPVSVSWKVASASTTDEAGKPMKSEETAWPRCSCTTSGNRFFSFNQMSKKRKSKTLKVNC